jgi:hypothetical protein
MRGNQNIQDLMMFDRSAISDTQPRLVGAPEQPHAAPCAAARGMFRICPDARLPRRRVAAAGPPRPRAVEAGSLGRRKSRRCRHRASRLRSCGLGGSPGRSAPGDARRRAAAACCHAHPECVFALRELRPAGSVSPWASGVGRARCIRHRQHMRSMRRTQASTSAPLLHV